MRKIFISLTFLLLLSCAAGAQISLVKKALKAQNKDKLEKSEKLIKKAIRKDSIMPAVYYAKASLLFDTDYPYYNIDSAYRNLKKGRMFFASLDEKQMRKHLGIGIDLVELNRLKGEIESSAFQRAEGINTEEGYIEYLQNFDGSKHQLLAIERRDSLAFIYASDINTYQAYEEFMEKYPNAIQVPDAKRKYERLYFFKSTADGKLNSYLKYLDKHPITPYRRDAEKAIFDISTADNLPKSYLSFIKKFPESQYAKKAKRILFYVDPLAYEWKSDSLDYVRKLNSIGPLILFNKNQKYGYVDYSGTVILPARYEDIKNEYLCSTLRTDFFQTNREVIGRNQSVIFSGLFEEAIDLGMGVLFINTPSGGFLIYKSGWPVTNQKIHNAQIVGEFISFKLNEKWGLMTITGKTIVKPEFDEIYIKGGFYFFRKGELFDISNLEKLAASADNAAIKFQTIYSEFEIMKDGYLWVQSNYGESLLDKNLHEVIPYGRKNITPLHNGYVVTSSSKNAVLNEIYKAQLSFGSGKTEFNSSYLIYEKELFYLHEYNSLGKYDSIELKGDYMAFAYRNDSTFLFFKEKHKVIRNGKFETKFLNASNSSQYLALPKMHGRGWVFYNEEGKIALDGYYDEVKPLGKEYLVVSHNGKKGLFTLGNVQLLSPKFEAIANYNEGYVSYLNKGKFGIINYTLGVQTGTDFDKNIQPYNSFILIGEKTGKKGLINNTGHSLTGFDFEDIQYWSDSVALVKQDYHWQLLDIFKNEIVGQKMKSFRYVRNDNIEKIVIGLVENGYGVFSNRKGEVISPTFNDVINLGTEKEPVYFTEKHVEEAEFYVVIYYDKDGKLLYKQAFEGKDYPLIYCEQ